MNMSVALADGLMRLFIMLPDIVIKLILHPLTPLIAIVGIVTLAGLGAVYNHFFPPKKKERKEIKNETPDLEAIKILFPETTVIKRNITKADIMRSLKTER